MRRDSGVTDSVWPTIREIPTDGPLGHDEKVDACVVGAGVAGLSTAYRLMKEGLKVIVVDDGPIAGGETARTTAHLVSALDDRYVELARLHGEKGARLAAESHVAAIDATEELVQSERIACQWKRLPGFLFDPPGGKGDLLEREWKAARDAGVEVDWAERAPMPGLDSGRCLRFERQGTLQPTAFLAGLTQVLRKGGVAVHTRTHAISLKRKDNLQVTVTDGHVIDARHVVEATNVPIFSSHGLPFKQAAYRTYCIAAPLPAATGEAKDALLWDTDDPYHYVRTWRPARSRTQHFIVGGGDHHTGTVREAQPIFDALESWMRQRYPDAGAVTNAWSGQVWEPVDALAFIGRSKPRGNQYIVTGDSGNGWTHAAIASLLLTDLIAGRPNPWEALYDPHRKTAKAAPEWLGELGAIAAKLPRLLMAGEVASTDQIAPGTGALVRKGLQMVAAYRDVDGVLHERSAICRHMGCTVAWNQTEKSWECPCHGSRYDRHGTVVNGPANADLKPLGRSKGRPERQSDGVRTPATSPGPVRRGHLRPPRVATPDAQE